MSGEDQRELNRRARVSWLCTLSRSSKSDWERPIYESKTKRESIQSLGAGIIYRSTVKLVTTSRRSRDASSLSLERERERARREQPSLLGREERGCENNSLFLGEKNAPFFFQQVLDLVYRGVSKLHGLPVIGGALIVVERSEHLKTARQAAPAIARRKNSSLFGSGTARFCEKENPPKRSAATRRSFWAVRRRATLGRSTTLRLS